MKYLTRHIDVPYGFYLNGKKDISVYCSNCENEHNLSKKKYGPITKILAKPYYCPSCGLKLDLHNAKYRNNFAFPVNFSEFEKTKFGFDINVYSLSCNFDSDEYDLSGQLYDSDEDPYVFRRRPMWSEKLIARYSFEKDNKVSYYSAVYLSGGYYCQYLTIGDFRERKSFPYFIDSYFLEDSLCELKNTDLEFLTKYVSEFFIDECLEKDFSLLAAKLVAIWQYPALLKVYKSGFIALFDDFVRSKYLRSADRCSKLISLRSKNLNKILKFDVNKLQIPREDVTLNVLEKIQKMISYDLDLTAKNIAIFNTERLRNFDCSLLTKKLFKYLRHQVNLCKYSDSYILSDYSDYIADLKKLKIPLTNDVLYPTNFRSAHTLLSNRVKTLEIEFKAELFKNCVLQYADLNTYGDYSIELITNPLSLKNAATYLHNCSFGYLDLILNGQCLIFLVKHKKSVIDAMLEFKLTGLNIGVAQLRGKCNNYVSDEIESFVSEWEHVALRKLKKVA